MIKVNWRTEVERLAVVKSNALRGKSEGFFYGENLEWSQRTL